MERESSPLEFAAFAREHWRTFLIVCIGAAILASAITLLLPKRYTATATILINAPAGNDPRAATVVSPVYLESLKTYELVASSDSLFAAAADRLHLRAKYPHTAIESLKRKALKVAKPANTRILEISATLEDPKDAQALASFLAAETIALSRSFDARAENEATAEAKKLVTRAQLRRETAEKARSAAGNSEPVQALQAHVDNLTELHANIQSDLAKVRAELAYYLAQESAAADNKPGSEWTRAQVTALRARARSLEAQERDTASEVKSQAAVLEKRTTLLDSLDAELKAARAESEAASIRLNDIRASSAFNGERLEILDPGVIPERPSFPNLPLNAVVAMLAALMGTTVYLAFRFTRERVQAARSLRAYRLRA